MLDEDEFKAFLKTLGIRIRQLRKDKSLLMRDIMMSTGYYDAQWRKYESGGSLNVASLLKIALALDVSLGELLDGLTQWPLLSVAQIQNQVGIDPQLAHDSDVELENATDTLPESISLSEVDPPLRKQNKASKAKPLGSPLGTIQDGSSQRRHTSAK